ncbi:MAG: ankyrin repeat domain-containing protein [Verrucomicrobiota bacterium]
MVLARLLDQYLRGFLPEMVKLLLANGAAVNAKNEDDETPLNRATSTSNDRTADLLRQHGGRE